MKAIVILVIVFLCCVSRSNAQVDAGSDKDREDLKQTSIGIRAAFAKGDVSAILSYHHRNVRKALGFTHIINGQDELEKDLKNTFANVKLKWLKNDVESLAFHDNTAVEMTVYTIEITPNDGGKPFTSTGRAMIVYVKDSQSPSGWATIRELIQPESEK